MTSRSLRIGVIAGSLVFLLSAHRANAASDKETCVATTANVMNTNADGTSCEAEVGGTGPNKATAQASDISTAVSNAGNGGTAVSKASLGSEAGAEADAG